MNRLKLLDGGEHLNLAGIEVKIKPQ